MGFFSWLDENGDSIRNRYTDEGARPIKMIDDTGREWIENDYEGYGEFGGMDYYELVAIMNEGIKDRNLGIQLCDVNNFDPAPPHIKTPRLVTPGCNKAWDELEPNLTCPSQGYFNW